MEGWCSVKCPSCGEEMEDGYCSLCGPVRRGGWNFDDDGNYEPWEDGFY